MDGGRRHIDNSEAMRHNEELARELQAYHERRSAEWPAYRRCMAQRKHMQEFMAKKFSQLQQAITHGNAVMSGRCPDFTPIDTDRHQAITDTHRPENVFQQAKSLPDDFPMPTSIYEYAFLAWLFESEESRRLRQEEQEAWNEIHRVEEEYDRKSIKMSGFEW